MHKATTAAGAPASAALEETPAWRCFAVFSRTDTEEDGSNEEAGQRGPFEAKGILANIGLETFVPEAVATLYIGSTVIQSARHSGDTRCGSGGGNTHVIRAALMAWKKDATKAKSPLR